MTHGDVFQTLADPTRRRVIDALRRGERSVNEIVATVGIHQSGVSRHLGILSAAGFVQNRVDGARRLYSLRPAPFREVAAWMSRYRSVWDRRQLTRRDRRAKGR
jgi:DNA-binding transcriptional ArsR family regulator